MTATLALVATSASLKNEPDCRYQLRTYGHAGEAPETVVCQLLYCEMTCALSVTTGVTAAACGTCCAIASPSESVSVDAAPMPAFTPPAFVLPGRMTITLLPRFAMEASIEAFAPAPIATVTITAATPMMIPRTVRSERSRFRISARNAIVIARGRFTSRNRP